MTAATTGQLLVEERGSVRVLVLSNPPRRNAVDPPMLARLREELTRANGDGTRCLLLRGEGDKAFCAGYDLTALVEANEAGPLPDAELQETVAAIEDSSVPVLAFVNGAAFGAGCELASACDLRIGTWQTTFSMPPAKLGIVYAPPGIARLIELVGPSRARAMFFTGRVVDAPTAEKWGLLDQVHERVEAETVALQLCREIADNAPLAVQGMRRIFRLLSKRELAPADAQEIEAIRRAAFRSDDAREAKDAFLVKRKPKFTGR